MCIRDRYVTVKVGTPSDPETIRSSVLLLSAMDLFDEVGVAVSYTHLRAHETVLDLVCRLLLEKKTV